MRRAFVYLLLIGFWGGAVAQTPSAPQSAKLHQNIASFGFGFGWMHKPEIARSLYFPSVSAVVERCVWDINRVGLLSVGAHFGVHYGFHKGTWVQQSYREDFINVFFLPRATLYWQDWFYEYGFPENVDLYFALELGFRAIAHNVHPNIGLPDDYNGFRFAYRIAVGARYYFTPRLAAFAEIGYGLSFANVGLTFKY